MARHYWNTFQALSLMVYFSLIIVTIPLAFDVGGEDCGIAFTCTLTSFYLVLSTLRIVFKNTRFGIISSSLYHLHPIIIPSTLILHLSVFSPTQANGLDPNLGQGGLQNSTVELWLKIIEPWRWFVKNSTPLFTIMEGFCSLLFLQTAGRLSSWLIRTKSDSWIIVQLLASSCTLSTSMYFLYRIYMFPVTISLISAMLIGVILTITVFLTLFGIVSGRGNSLESSLLFAYIVYCLYFTFTDFQSSISASTFLYFFSSASRPDIPPMPLIIVNGYTSLVSSVASLVPAGFKTVFQFLQGAVSTVTPSVFVSLSYRLGVFFAATQIIPVVHEVSHSRRNSLASQTDVDINWEPSKVGLDKSVETALDEDDEEEEEEEEEYFAGDEDEYDDVTIAQFDEQLDEYFLQEKKEHQFSNMTLPQTLPYASMSSPPPRTSKTLMIKFIIFSYSPCILIAVYTHLLIQHLTLFNSISSNGINSANTFTSSLNATAAALVSALGLNNSNSNVTPTVLHAAWTWSQGWASPLDSWQFWGWVNMFSTLFLYSLELIFGKENNQEEIIEHHWNSDWQIK